jgi:hypothetical protein
MMLKQITTIQIAHYAAMLAVFNALIYWAWNQHIDNGHWVTVFGNARIHPIPAVAWLLVFVPSLLTAILGLIVLARRDNKIISSAEGLTACLSGGWFCVSLFIGWCVNTL